MLCFVFQAQAASAEEEKCKAQELVHSMAAEGEERDKERRLVVQGLKEQLAEAKSATVHQNGKQCVMFVFFPSVLMLPLLQLSSGVLLLLLMWATRTKTDHHHI